METMEQESWRCARDWREGQGMESQPAGENRDLADRFLL